MSVPATSPNSVQVRLRVLRKIKVNNHVDRLDIDSTSEKIRRDQAAAGALSKVVEHSVSVLLRHLRVNKKTRIAKFCDFFGQKFNSHCRIAENNCLVDLQLNKNLLLRTEC